VIFFRSFERGNLRETLSCGTGALACAAVLGKGDAIRVVPEMARRRMNASGYTVIPGKREWYLYGDPEILWEGVWTGFRLEEGAGIDSFSA
jgi:diaminopimelate epimerase